MKKYIYLLISLVAFSCATDDSLINDQNLENKSEVIQKSIANDQNVTLIKAWNSYSFYRGFNTWTRRFTVKVANLSYDKNVSVFHEKVDGSWEEIPLSFSISVDDQNEIWTGEYRYTAYTDGKIYDDEFAIKYEVNGTTYWDNNNGDNYRIEEKEIGALFAQPDLNISVDADFDSLYPVYGSDGLRFSVVADIRNISPYKEVEVVYTTDGWQTQQYLSLSYTPRWYSGYNYVLLSPNQFGIERWTGSVNVDESVNTIEYAVVYKVNGQEYWDNNYGRNYRIISSN
ncbi:hypothetical protein U6A24_01885 [Aquimarina gracilis]|uniref:CBM21 domain-containing protein n=1 Tax=Aquimarina gracilis TaxID=874422 RepID=A0ABU5ZQ38_9FLAO|nr:hypothetical protein [Aquimarina gracilis]MEB3344188.1 hypothetical protein [Aquimarina gracilis]